MNHATVAPERAETPILERALAAAKEVVTSRTNPDDFEKIWPAIKARLNAEIPPYAWAHPDDQLVIAEVRFWAGMLLQAARIDRALVGTLILSA